MAAGMISKPGTQYGPCEGECEHTDCADQRKRVENKCIHCGKRIGYETKFYAGGQGYSHWTCTWAKLEENADDSGRTP